MTSREVEVAKAAWQLEDVMNEKFVPQYPDELEARKIQLKVQNAEVWASRATVGMVLLSVFETPSWCDTSSDFFWYNDTRCAKLNVDTNMLLTSNIAYLPPGWSLLMETVLIGCIFRHLWLRKQLQNKFFDTMKVQDKKTGEIKGVIYYPPSHFKFGIAMMALEFFDVAVFFFHPIGRWRFAVFSRTGILCLLPSVQKLASTVSKVIYEYISVAVFFIGFIVFFAWITVTIFSDLSDPVNGIIPNKGFDTLSHSLNSFWIAGICEDFVQVFKNSYTAYRGAGLLWFFFLLIAHLLLLSLVLDTLVAAYRSKTEEDEEESKSEIAKGIHEAFEGLARGTRNDGEEDLPLQVRQDAFKEFVKEFGKSPSIPTICDEHADVVFKAVDQSGDGVIEEDEFSQICTVIQYQFWTTKRDSVFAEKFPKWCGEESWLGKFVRKEGGISFENVMNCILMVNFALVVMETNFDLTQIEEKLKNPNVQNKDEPAWMENLEFAFSFVYLGEVACRLAVFSWAEYSSYVANMFDFTTTWLLLFSAILEKFAKSSLATYANMLRLLRLLRMVKAIKIIESVQFMIDTVVKLVKASQDIVTLLFVVLFFFTTLSVQVFGGELYKGAPHIEETEYNEKSMFVLNFNDWPCAFGVWMVILLAEYKPEFPDVCFEVTKNKKGIIAHSWIMFPLFYVVGGSIIFELVKAFTIEVFIKLKEKWDKKKVKKMKNGGEDEEDPVLKKVREEFRKFDERLELHYKMIGTPLPEDEEEGESEKGSHKGEHE